jgi:hypothetical protein
VEWTSLILVLVELCVHERPRVSCRCSAGVVSRGQSIQKNPRLAADMFADGLYLDGWSRDNYFRFVGRTFRPFYTHKN